MALTPGFLISNKPSNELWSQAATLHTWIHVLKKQGNLGAIDAASAKNMTALVEENHRLQKEFTIAKEERNKGNCWGNALAESGFHSLKSELIYTEKYATRETAKQSIFQYIAMDYNQFRQHSIIGSIATTVFENLYKIVV